MSNSDVTEDRGFDHAAIEPKWQQEWDKADVFRIEDDATDPEYVLAMFPYPSGEMHMGHVRNYAITDAHARFKRMQGEDVLHPMGWDSFGLPAENAANDRDTNPRAWTMDCIDDMKAQMSMLGLGFNWDREITTCEPEYYRWNQWLFQQFHDAGLVERQTAELNWCPDCETVLADENVEGEDELCWRCDTPINRREMDQWFFTITDYAEELTEDLDSLHNWPDNVREMQRNWIGIQEGASVAFELTTGDSVDIFTTRLDTIYGATFFALSPGHEVAQELAEENDAIADYVERVKDADEDEIEQTSGVFTGEYATNPATGEEIPVYVADYVLDDIGTGALYAVPGHDERDHAFAEEHDIEIQQVVEPTKDTAVDAEEIDVQSKAYTKDGRLVNSGEFDGLASQAAREQFVEEFDGEFRTTHSLRDWCISRQRYWGTPIPFVNCPDCGEVQVPETDLPVELPEFIQTTGNPLDAADEWKATTCPECGGKATRETDTMNTFIDSSWYFLRFISPGFEDGPFDTEQASTWLPVDQYVGGIEHATMHLLYARFFTKVLDDIDLLEDCREPFESLLTQGMVLGSNGNKMSKSKGNGVSPVRIVEEYGADTARLFIMEAAQPDKDFPWDPEGVESASQFLQNVYRLTTSFTEGDIETGDGSTVDDQITQEIQATAATATTEFEQMRYNHALQAVRDLVSLLWQYAEYTEPDAETFEHGLSTVAKLLSPTAPHLAEEVWQALGNDTVVAKAAWPAVEMPENYEMADKLIENTQEDIRDIIDVANIDDASRVEIAVAPEWKHRVREIAKETDGDVVGAVMSDGDLREHGEAAADFAKEFIGQEHFDEQLSPAEESTALDRAMWLIEREFDADVTVYGPTESPDSLASKATPGRPGINIEE
ncbi:leucine--tRNA ligase [Halovenus rubra]|uniref:Leucine--tRNA ligase n=2 Tax=Halovenus rubra TaxID=869890 RepID=A0ACC7E2V0_9EURY|nr:leucine--tRNA ligase [Halovenus rubra]